MRKVLILTFAALLLLISAAGLHAADLKARGYWWIEGVNKGGWDFLKKGEENTFFIEQKLRTAFFLTANENLRGVLDTQIGTQTWGTGLYSIGAGRAASTAAGANAGSNAAGTGNIMLRKAYIEYKIPGTLINTSVGFQTVSLPSAFGGGSPIFDDQVSSAVVSTPITDSISLTAGYARPLQGSDSGGSGSSFDVFFASVPVKQQGFTLTPFAAYAYGGAKSGVLSNTPSLSTAGFAGPNSSESNGLRGYWGGMAFTMDAFQPFKVMADFNYGKATYNNNVGNAATGGRSGYMFDLAVDYTALNWVTPELFFTYSSGENGNSSRGGGSERMPVIGLPQNWTIGSFFFGERLELAGSINTTAGYTRQTLGYWATGLSLKNMTFVDKLSHDFNLLYARGTNNADYLKETGGGIRNAAFGGFLTTKDSLWEVDFNSRYKIYDELTAYLYLGYINANFNQDVWSASTVTNVSLIQQGVGSNAYKIGLGLNYFF